MATLSGYTNGEILSMQNDAVRRVQEMQRLAKARVAQSGDIPQESKKADISSQATQDIERCDAQVVNNGFAGILEKLNLDEEKILIILLGIILISEGADIMLVLALGYLLLG